jgi:hypothetical protein
VNLFTNDTYPSGDIDVYQGFSAQDACGKKLATIPYGEASDYIDVTAADGDGNWETVAYIAGKTDDDSKIISQTETWKGGEQITIIFYNQDPDSGNPPAFGSDQVFFEKDPGDPSSLTTTPPSKALILVSASPLQYTIPDGAWVVGNQGDAECLKSTEDTENTRTNVGGTSLVQYPVDPGSYSLSLYPSDPGKCTVTSDFGPAAVDATADSQTYVFAYGPDKDNVKLLVLPVEK